MKLLLIESTVGNGAAIHRNLLAEGHDVVTCSDANGGPCRGAQHTHDCPMEQHIDLTIVARETGSPHTLTEMGSVCATRHRVPLVEVDPDVLAGEMPSVTIANALATRKVEAAYATAVRQELSWADAQVEVHRDVDRIHVKVTLPADRGDNHTLARAADRARHAVREYDPFVRGIDVSVVAAG